MSLLTLALILLAIAYLLVGCWLAFGICVEHIMDRNGPTLFEFVLIVVGWGWLEYLAWREKQRG